jgi:hypothetical protein
MPPKSITFPYISEEIREFDVQLSRSITNENQFVERANKVLTES